MINLEAGGYVLNPDTGVWSRPGYQSLAYSDGDDSESWLAQIIRQASDLSVLSRELSSHCHDWASLYHLGLARGNILRPFEHCLTGNILEIGAGCGAISRYLGECGGTVLSLEGSLRRAQIAASRTRDLDNVTVVAESFDHFNIDQRFDVITLIGVLEYASVFSTDNDAALRMLRRIHDLLTPDGKLFIAIENQLGLKYFAGAPEDHLAVPMHGIEGRYLKGQPETFGRQTLADLITKAGFNHSEFLSPTPDYKLPSAIITERGFSSRSFDVAAFAWQSVRKDPQLPLATFFNLERAWPVVVRNGLGMELANSFLVAVSRSSKPCVDPDVLAFHYNTGRKSIYCKESRFVDTPTGIEVRHTSLNGLAPYQPDAAFHFILSKVDTYVRGRILSQDFLNIASTANWTIDDFGQFIRRYVSYLKLLLAERKSNMALEHVSERLPGRFIDAMPQNVVITEGNGPALIDVEWEMAAGVELGHLLTRSLLLMIASATPFAVSTAHPSRKDFITQVLRAAGLHITDEQLQGYIEKEAQFQEFVTGQAADSFLDWAAEAPITQKMLPLTSKKHYARLYYSTDGEAFVEAQAASIEVLPGRQTLEFPFSAFKTSARHLRLDPVDTCLSFSLTHLQILDGQTPVWSWDDEVSSLVSDSGVIRVEQPQYPGLFLSTDEDPYLELPVDLSLFDDLSRLTLVAELELHTDEADNGNDHVQAMLQPLVELNEILARKKSELEGVIELMQVREKETQSALEQLQAEHRQAFDENGMALKRLETSFLRQQADKDTHVHHLNLRIMSLEGSFSWRLTAPLRRSVGAARRFERLSKRFPSIIRRGGGLKATTLKAVTIFRRHGMPGLWTRLRWFSGIDQFAPANSVSAVDTDRHDYAQWVERYDTLGHHGRWKITEHIRTWEHRPLISIIMPVFDPPMDLLREAIECIQNQLYTNWELCIADDASTDPQVLEYLRLVEDQDPRIKVVAREKNGHISAASNSAVAVATGEFITLMDNDDLISERALYWIARTIIEHPTAGVIYSDEDKIDRSGQRSTPYFKSDWNEFLFRSQNMISHLGAFRRELVEQVGGFREGFEGSQDYDLALRCIEMLDVSQIVHVPRVLYHWRIHAGSTALAGAEKPYAALAGVRALDEYLQRKGCVAKTELLPINMYRVHYQLPSQQPLVSLIIPTRNAQALVRQCINSVKALTTYHNYEIILIDNGSDDPEALEYFSQLGQEPNITIYRDDGPFNYSALNNRAVQRANGELVCLLNNDIEVITPGWLDELVSIALQPGVGAVGACLWYPDERLQHGGVIAGLLGVAGHAHRYLPRGEHGYFGRASLIQEFSIVTAACLVIRKQIYEQVSGLDEVNLKIAFNDVDFCLRVQEAGYVNVWTPFAEMYHYESATRGLEDTPEKKQRFNQEINYMQSRWPNLRRDYVYNPNLTLEHEDFGLAWPPRVED